MKEFSDRSDVIGWIPANEAVTKETAILREQLDSASWQKPANVFWLGHDLCWLIHIIQNGDAKDSITHAFNQSIHHLRNIGGTDSVEEGKLMDLKERLTSLPESDWPDHIRYEYTNTLSDVMGRLGAMAESIQPGFRPKP